ncbi:MarR family winged helix-turn-helix transcriptional regulator [Streptomyces albidoflavus]|uniref:MarR family transcriptional regulator n=4 Tax=Streptomyces TaxID=1883 RepID=A0ACC7Y447_9ACTN|nr:MULTISPECIES: MarR family transcriptional regulator [Streptomyces]MYQ73055.1 MarR family transcriptional regulator [Streptomyces sp. SID4934]MYW61545.1 MarR family transcriptional regulator [Streptomyces sp. SID8370]MYW83455.1 MarR family transcriptional regulator [Streptomyces sp. SID8371]MYX52605.1 MarR family transcriptional regulator [Streptomyces sp. SID8385]MYX84160.1 MarR family transcriptional regulator [Streptomyces sp. SID4915]NUW10130.1 MarR family transcriptional regulator [Str
MPHSPDAPLDRLVKAVTSLSYALGRSRVHEELTASVGVTVERPEIALLRVLYASPEPLRVTDLAARLLVRSPHVTRQVARLEAAGLVRRVPDALDHRTHLLSTTAHGRQVVDRIDQGMRDSFRATLDDMTDRQLADAAEVMERLAADAAARHEEPHPAPPPTRGGG